MKSVWGDFTNKYSLSKTLRFELKPIGKTAEQIKHKELIEQDEIRVEYFQKVKKIIDEFYKFHINDALSHLDIPEDLFAGFKQTYISVKTNKFDKKLQSDFEKSKKNLRTALFNNYKASYGALYSKLFDGKLLKELSKYFRDNSEKVALLQKFDGFTTYFTGFFKNRKNMFSPDEISTSIFYRIVDDNLPKFIDNVEKFEKLKEFSLDFSQVKKLELDSLERFFTLKNYLQFVSQEGIDEYNLLLGGKTLEGGVKLQGLNELINIQSQNVSDVERKKLKKLQFEPLFKQILSDRKSVSFVDEVISNDQELLCAINEFDEQVMPKIYQLQKLFSSFDEIDLDKVYVNAKSLNKISKDMFGDFHILNHLLESEANSRFKTKKEIDAWLKRDCYSFSELNDLIREYLGVLDDIDKKELLEKIEVSNPLESHFSQKERLVVDEKREEFKKIISSFRKDDEEAVQKIKEYLDLLIEIFHFIRPLYVEVPQELDANFYVKFNELFVGDEQCGIKDIVPLYNKVRNYLTKKRYSTEKFKLNFESSSFLSGWDSEFNTKAGILFKKENNYFLGVVPKKLSQEENALLHQDAERKIKLVQYKFQKPDYKNFPRTFIRSKGDRFAPAVEKYNLPINEILEIYDEGYYKTEYKKINESVFRTSLKKLIDYFKLGVQQHKSYKEFNFQWKKSNEYEDINEFYSDVISSCYEIDFQDVSEDYINELVDSGKLYLFQIYNKDFSPHSTGRPNLHTMYWRALFSEENLKDVVYKVNGEAEIFYRRASVAYKVTHPKNQPIENKDPLLDEKTGELKKTSTFEYDLIKDKRYAQDKFLFHCPITLNFKAHGRDNINADVLDVLKKKNPTILSIDRGERHLAYWTLLDLEGKIINHGTFNIVTDDKSRDRDYHEKLHTLEKERDASRKSWKEIHNIKELKEGYLSQVVHKICRMVTENNAIVVFEDLNFGFKRGRFKIEKQVYQKFEKMLIDKLNYLVFKERNPEEKGGLLNAYQLTSKFDSFKKLGKQSGILFFVNANFTSKICPKTGFVNLLYPKYENENKAKEFFSRFKRILYHPSEDLFEFNFNYSDFGTKGLVRDDWSVYSYGERSVSKKNKNGIYEYEIIDLTFKMKKLFSEANISLDKDLKKQILNQDASFLKKFIHYFRLLLQLRNSTDKTDFILSCVKDKNGEFFDSRNSKDIPNADANGAYNIGVKGLMLVENVRKKGKAEKIDRDDYLNFVINRCQ